MVDIRNALDILALQNSEGRLSDDLLSKACDTYKVNSDFIEDYAYHVKVSKSIFDYLNNVKTDEEIIKALVPGQTKVVDGIVYIYTATPGAKTLYDWRVFNNANKRKSQVGRQVDDVKAKAKADHVNQLFPVDLKGLKVIQRLGGSTGAQLVEDSRGERYVMKKGSNTSNAHLESEYLVNQMYDIMGLRVPDYEMYDDNGDKVMLSRFIPITKMPTSADRKSMAQGFVVDALFSNWDIYMNDNCLIDSAGRVVRVDSGGALKFRAQGGAKRSFGNKVDDFDSMISYNPWIESVLTEDEMIQQLDNALGKKDLLLAYIDSGITVDDDMFNLMDARFQDLKNIRDRLVTKKAAKNKVVLPRNLKTDAEMYRSFTADEVKGFWTKQGGTDYRSKLRDRDNLGWALLGDVCRARGFDARPLAVDEDEYWKAVAGSEYQMFRGLAQDSQDASFYADDFIYNDSCFFGNVGIYGAGIYAHVNADEGSDKTKNGHKNTPAYNNARSYARSSGVILDLVLDKSAKVAKVKDLREEIKKIKLFDTTDPKFIKLDGELRKLTDELSSDEDKLKNISANTEAEVKRDMHWNETVLVDHQIEIDNVDWGSVNDEGEPNYPNFEDFVEAKMFDWVKDNGGTITMKGKDVKTGSFVMKLPNSQDKFEISKYQWENNAIKRKNAFANAYNYPLERFKTWMMNNHYGVINKAVADKLEKLGGETKKLQTSIANLSVKVKNKTSEMDTLKAVKNPDADMMAGIYEDVVNRGNLEGVGVYAAIKGYDALIEPNGNHGKNPFMIILNRSKVIVRK